MSRDPNKLKVFVVADDLVVEVYKATQRFPVAERFALQSQIRRASVSVPSNLVEGCSRTTHREYTRFVEIALGSCNETAYLLGLAHRLGFLPSNSLATRYAGLGRGLQVLLTS